MATDVAISLGMGRGEFAGSLSSMRALCAMVIPLLYSQLFNVGQRLNVPGLHFYGVLLFTLAKDLLERSSPRRAQALITVHFMECVSTCLRFIRAQTVCVATNLRA